MSTAKLAVFRADASSTIGLGHLVRSSTLADELHHGGGWDVRLAMAEGMEVAPDLFRGGSMAEARPAGEDESAWLERAFPEGCDLLVVDHYGWSAQQEQAREGWAARTLVIDDLANRAHACQILVDQTMGRRETEYEALVPQGCMVLAGSQFAMLRPQFAHARSRAARRPLARGLVPRLVVSLGGMDAKGLARRVVSALGRSRLELELDVVVGWDERAAADVEAVAAQMTHPVRVHRHVEDMASLLVHADLAIGAAGSAAWERCCVGLPSVLLTTAGNQLEIARTLCEAGAARLAGSAGQFDEPSFLDMVEQTLADADTLGQMSLAASRVCDGFGAARVRIAAEARGAEPVYLRRATMEDTELLWQWQQDPVTRRFSRNPAVPTLSEHRAWMQRKLADPGCCFNLIVCAGEVTGVLRFDRLAPDDDRHEISINVAPRAHGRSIAGRALALRRELLPQAEFVAEVLPENEASRRLFLRAGFEPRGTTYVDSALRITEASDECRA